ncbi:MAG: hypothetical protein NZM12_07190, partial [Steroidobacteraceae bacterium]|nr:hypothetical protein [Steroidobacteraceae bacterium]MDW8259778.1 hypothetical protein [Gammaproteobacteria bacterium]
AGWHTVFAARSDARSAQSLYPASRAVHLWHAMMHRQPGFDKNGLFPPTSVFETLWRAYTQKRRDSDSDALSMS